MMVDIPHITVIDIRAVLLGVVILLIPTIVMLRLAIQVAIVSLVLILALTAIQQGEGIAIPLPVVIGMVLRVVIVSLAVIPAWIVILPVENVILVDLWDTLEVKVVILVVPEAIPVVRVAIQGVRVHILLDRVEAIQVAPWIVLLREWSIVTLCQECHLMTIGIPPCTTIVSPWMVATLRFILIVTQ